MTEMARADRRSAEAEVNRRRRVAAWIGSPLAIVSGGALLALGVTAPGGAVFTAGGVALMLAGFLWGTVYYLRLVDEQERDATLWGCYAGMCVYLFLFAAHLVLARYAPETPFGHSFIFYATSATVVVVFLWRRFR